ncbi:hypothetical protein [Tessaracoccus sp. G1721]
MSTLQPHGKVAPILALIGSLLLLAGILWGVTAGQGLTRVVPEAAGVIRVDGDTVVPVTDGEIQVVYAPAGVVPTCDVYGPTDAVPNLALEGFFTFPLNDVTYESIGKMGGPGELSGDYIIVCQEGDGVVVAPPLDVRNDVGAVRALIGAIILGGTGAVLMVTGGVMWLMARRAASAQYQAA